MVRHESMAALSIPHDRSHDDRGVVGSSCLYFQADNGSAPISEGFAQSLGDKPLDGLVRRLLRREPSHPTTATPTPRVAQRDLGERRRRQSDPGRTAGDETWNWNSYKSALGRTSDFHFRRPK